MANTLRFSCKGCVGFIDWLGRSTIAADHDMFVDNLPLATDTANNVRMKRSVTATDIAKLRIVSGEHPNGNPAVVLPLVVCDLSV